VRADDEEVVGPDELGDRRSDVARELPTGHVGLGPAGEHTLAGLGEECVGVLLRAERRVGPVRSVRPVGVDEDQYDGSRFAREPLDDPLQRGTAGTRAVDTHHVTMGSRGPVR
jgi:hypothetical protein